MNSRCWLNGGYAHAFLRGFILPYTRARGVTRWLCCILEVSRCLWIGYVPCSLTMLRSEYPTVSWQKLCAASVFSTFGASFSATFPRTSLSPYYPLGLRWYSLLGSLVPSLCLSVASQRFLRSIGSKRLPVFRLLSSFSNRPYLAFCKHVCVGHSVTSKPVSPFLPIKPTL
jgi:hypothetical protein